MAKTQYSLSDDATKLGRPSDFIVTIRELKPSIGAGFIVALTGTMLTMRVFQNNQQHFKWM